MYRSGHLLLMIHRLFAPDCSPKGVRLNTRMLVAELTNDTTLRWDPSPEDSVAGYEIVWRDTTSSQWEEFQDVGNVTEGTVPLSKDNWFFGVRSYDKDGFRSMVSYPRPARE